MRDYKGHKEFNREGEEGEEGRKENGPRRPKTAPDAPKNGAWHPKTAPAASENRARRPKMICAIIKGTKNLTAKAKKAKKEGENTAGKRPPAPQNRARRLRANLIWKI
jgi:hypothetical protein